MLTILTMTGERPESFELCKRWMRNQTYRGAVRWLIVDDGRLAQRYSDTPAGWDIWVIRRAPYWEPGQNTQALNILAGLEHVDADARLVVVEDDDYYHPHYLAAVDGWLETADLVGESHTLYVNLANATAHRNKNHAHASLCATAIKGAAIDRFREMAAGNHKFVDMKLWGGFTGSKRLHASDHVVGIKGLPGRAGIGAGHRMIGALGIDQLRQYLGDDAQHYDGFIGVAA